MSGQKIELVKFADLAKYELSFQEIDTLFESDYEDAKRSLTEQKEKEHDKMIAKMNDKKNERNEQIAKAKMENEKKRVELLETVKSALENGNKVVIPKTKKVKTDIIEDVKPKPVIMKEIKDQEIKEYVVKYGELTKYLKLRILPSNEDGYFIVENGKLVLKSSRFFHEKIKPKLDAKCKKYVEILRDSDGLYNCDVYDEDFVIDHSNHRVNIAKPFKFGCTVKSAEEVTLGKRAKKVMDFVEKIICGGKKDQYECLLNVLTYATHRKQSGVITFLCALGGVGKTFFCDILRLIFGSAYANTSESVLSGEDKFNKSLVGSVFAGLEETAGTENYQKLMRSIKEIATSQNLVARLMYSDGYEVKNMLNIIVLSNYFRDLNVGDRRVFVPEISNEKQEDKEYFTKLKEALTEKALQEIFNYLYTRPIVGSIIIPVTESKEEYKEMHMSAPVKFLVDNYMIANRYENHSVSTRDLFAEFETQTKNSKLTCKRDTFFNTIRMYVPYAQNSEGRVKAVRGFNHFDVSYQTLYDRIIKRSRVISEARFEEMKIEYEDNNKTELDNVFGDPQTEQQKNFVKEIDLLNEENIKLKTENEKLKLELENLKKVTKTQNTENTASRSKIKPDAYFWKEMDKLRIDSWAF